jgi:hypothetical protein
MDILDHPTFENKYCPICGTREDKPVICVLNKQCNENTLIHVKCVNFSLISRKCENDDDVTIISMIYKDKPLFPGQ